MEGTNTQETVMGVTANPTSGSTDMCAVSGAGHKNPEVTGAEATWTKRS